ASMQEAPRQVGSTGRGAGWLSIDVRVGGRRSEDFQQFRRNVVFINGAGTESLVEFLNGIDAVGVQEVHDGRGLRVGQNGKAHALDAELLGQLGNVVAEDLPFVRGQLANLALQQFHGSRKEGS